MSIRPNAQIDDGDKRSGCRDAGCQQLEDGRGSAHNQRYRREQSENKYCPTNEGPVRCPELVQFDSLVLRVFHIRSVAVSLRDQACRIQSTSWSCAWHCASMWGKEDLVTDVSAGCWIDAALREFIAAHGVGKVGAVLCAEYAAYARVLHAAYRWVDSSCELYELVSWSSLALANGRTMHPLVEWERIVGSSLDAPRGGWDRSPRTGGLDPVPVRMLSSVLARHTGTPKTCWYAVWEGHTALDDLRTSAALTEILGRNYFLVCDDVSAIDKCLNGVSPTLWWPDDRAWCVSSDADLMSTYVGGTAECIAEIIDSAELEAFPVRSSDKVTWDSDTVNPPIRRR